jgi:hypothetical protein
MNNKYTLERTLKVIESEIVQSKSIVLIAGLFSLFISILIMPIAIYSLYIILNYAHVPLASHALDYLNIKTTILVSLDLILLVYLLMLINDVDKKKKINFNKTYLLTFITLAISFLPVYFTNINLILIIYTIFFYITVFHISSTYYHNKFQVPDYEKSYKGGYGGLIDDPFTLEDDKNRIRVSIEGALSLFSFIFFFYKQIRDSIVFLYVIRDKKNILESARLFAYILDNGVESKKIDTHFSIFSKLILETIDFVSFKEHVILSEKGENKALEIEKVY